jgi:hypothetical protein
MRRCRHSRACWPRTHNENRTRDSAHSRRHDHGDRRHALPFDHDGEHDLDDLRRPEGEDGMPGQPVGHDHVHRLSTTLTP